VDHTIEFAALDDHPLIDYQSQSALLDLTDEPLIKEP
jgi:hypothetical protein